VPSYTPAPIGEDDRDHQGQGQAIQAGDGERGLGSMVAGMMGKMGGQQGYNNQQGYNQQGYNVRASLDDIFPGLIERAMLTSAATRLPAGLPAGLPTTSARLWPEPELPNFVPIQRFRRSQRRHGSRRGSRPRDGRSARKQPDGQGGYMSESRENSHTDQGGG
jgi:hypothetical protein